MMLKYRGPQIIRAGFIGVVLVMLTIIAGLNTQALTTWATSVRFQALFADAGGLAVGNDVTRSGIKIGSVSDISLQQGLALVTVTVDGHYRLGSQTTAHIRTGTLLGQRVVTLDSAGSGSMRPNTVIPIARTSTPYSLTEAVSDLTTTTAGTDTASLNQALDTLSTTIDTIAPQVGPTFDGLTRLSQVLNQRNDSLRDLLTHAADLTGVLSQRSDRVNTLILNANDLVGVLDERRQTLVNLLENVAAVSQQLSGLVADNKAKLAPTLDKLNSVTAILEKNRDNIAKALPGLAKYELTQAETVSSGFYYTAFIPNLVPAQMLQPFMDYALGFRRGVDAGQPPDNAGPRAELPFPYNGIPGGSR
ncbi:phospholipid/cholesterol/gamma-HCH transport system substrate-binding protein [Mycolicibacterium sp. BK556]|nr:phospholipid/cholesterol/gamma-HCH transport system substrate-binding protein [Mycolicibacterium sp. BK556]MBB3633013.1 phospholipid/cholesterol/gamma-HCH transport system substrate-binding protein [Mycolicibacterium sp. BK607]MBB3750560.1 phospholipid/cholesterol/gamma-HCH transport system substrate-binding protein [Mycolicibacterium sp. BK634]